MPEPANQSMSAAAQVLASFFGYDAFRPGQSQLVEALLSGRDALGVMPTGAGKSICYQVPALVKPGLALVVSPLVSLMDDQVRALKEAGVRGSYVNSTLSARQQAIVFERALAGEYDIMYVAPERLDTPSFAEFACRVPLSLVAVDEAHCVSQWGQDFRPSYLRIGAFLASLPVRPPVIALTATATSRVREDIARLLGLVDPMVLVTGFDRPNLRYSVERLEPKRKFARIVSYFRDHPGDSGIVYCSTRKDVEKLHEQLALEGVSVTRYHAGLTTAERVENQRAFITDNVSVMVATNAFGMGIDKSNVRFVIHYNMPGSLEAYYQEAGRAGRDGLPADCLLLWCDGDIGTSRFFIEQEVENEALTPEEVEVVRASRRRLLERMVGYGYTTECLRAYTLNYFGEAAPSECGFCSNCTGSFKTVDVTQEARAVMRCVHELRGRFGKGVVCDVLRGANTERVASFGLSSCKTFGCVDASQALLKEVIELLAVGEYLVVSEGKFPLVGLGPRAREAAEDGFSLIMKQDVRINPRKNAKATRSSGAFGHSGSRDEGLLDASANELFERLRVLRKRIADEASVPPYVVFSDASLRDMCAKLPANEEEFLEVSGVGATKLERYGKAFLAEINK